MEVVGIRDRETVRPLKFYLREIFCTMIENSDCLKFFHQEIGFCNPCLRALAFVSRVIIIPLMTFIYVCVVFLFFILKVLDEPVEDVGTLHPPEPGV